MLGKREVNSRAYFGAFNFKGADQQKKVGTLSGGERNRVHLAKMLKSGANVLLLDEPTNDLDVDTLRALEEALEDFAGCAVIISHDRWFLDRIATHILAFEGDSHVEWFEGNFQDYEEDKMRRLGTDRSCRTGSNTRNFHDESRRYFGTREAISLNQRAPPNVRKSGSLAIICGDWNLPIFQSIREKIPATHFIAAKRGEDSALVCGASGINCFNFFELSIGLN